MLVILVIFNLKQHKGNKAEEQSVYSLSAMFHILRDPCLIRNPVTEENKQNICCEFTGLLTLEDREERAQSQTSRCSSQHPQRHVSSILMLSLLNNNVVHSWSNISTYTTQPLHSNIAHLTHHSSVHICRYLPWYWYWYWYG